MCIECVYLYVLKNRMAEGAILKEIVGIYNLVYLRELFILRLI